MILALGSEQPIGEMQQPPAEMAAGRTYGGPGPGRGEGASDWRRGSSRTTPTPPLGRGSPEAGAGRRQYPQQGGKDRPARLM